MAANISIHVFHQAALMVVFAEWAQQSIQMHQSGAMTAA